MKKEILLYSQIYDFTSELFVTQVDAVEEGPLTIRVNCPGGNVFAAWGMVAKCLERSELPKIKVDGIAASMAALFVAFFDDVECLDVSRIMIHRADGYVATAEEQEVLNSINRDMKAKLVKKIDAKKLKELKGVTLDQIFAEDTRIDLWLTAKEAKEIGLVKKIVTMKPREIQAVQDTWAKIAAVLEAESASTSPEPPVKPTPVTNPKNDNKMTIEKLKAEHPEVHAAVAKAAIDGERDRVGAWMAFAAVDPERVAKGIKDGETLSQTAMSELTLKAVSKNGIANLAADSTPPVETGEADKPGTEAQKKTAAFEKEVRAKLGLKAEA